jgi:hypothetical protein
MGQRHQTFIKVANPIKHVYKEKVTAQMKKVFGTEETTILPFHNQWLYGRTALTHALNILTHASQLEREQKIGDTKSWSSYSNPFGVNFLKQKFDTADKWLRTIEFVMNYIPKNTEFNEAGFLGSFYIGEEDYGIQNDFRMGDNNDGITIIDAIENKYCFMNINDYKTDDELCHSASDLPYMLPCSAHDYVKCYYGETVKAISDYHLKEGVENGLTHRQTATSNKKENSVLVKQFADFTLLTPHDLAVMFPMIAVEIREGQREHQIKTEIKFAH